MTCKVIADNNTAGLRIDTSVSSKRADDMREIEDYPQAASRSIFLRFRSRSSNISRSAALCGGVGRFEPVEVEVDGVGLEAAVLKTFGLLSGFVPAFKGFALNFRPPEDAVVAGTTGFAENDKTTFSAPSSRFRPSSTGGDDSESEAAGSSSALARSICSAISKRSRCSSDTVERSFLSAASCNKTSGQRNIIVSGLAISDLLLQGFRTVINPSNKPPFLRLVHPCNSGSS